MFLSKIPLRILTFVSIPLIFAIFGANVQSSVKSEWAFPGVDGKLVYKTTPTGDRIMDFSYAGYMGGGVAIPDVAVKKTIQPSGGADDTAHIQAAIDAVAALPLKDGFRGALLLGPGTYICSGTLKIAADGIVLRGSGSGAGKGPISTIKLVGKPHNGIAVAAAGTPKGEVSDVKQASAKTIIADAYVPSGAMTFNVANAKGFAIGDTIAIRKVVTADWVHFMKMDDLVRDGKPQTWLAVGRTLTTERRITAMAANKITLDVPLSDSFEPKYFQPAGIAVVKIKPPVRVTQVGIENLHIECPLQAIPHTQPHFSAVRINGQDCWMRDVVADETMNSIEVKGRRITVERVAVNRKALHQGASRPGEFGPNASEVLLDRCTCKADNVWFSWTGSGQAGPIVLLNCTFEGDGRAEAHMRWSTGMLYDNCKALGGGLDFRNRGVMGSGHGWSMGWGVAWNCVAKEFTIQNPPGAVNWMIGCVGKAKDAPRPFDKGTPNLPGATTDSPGAAVAPRSLYLAQLTERLGPQALKQIGY
jgi:hypothetical protein